MIRAGGSRDGTEAIIEVVGKENLTKMAENVEKAVDKAAVSTGRMTAGFNDASKSALTTNERVALLATGVDSMLNLFGKAVAAAKQVQEHVENAAKSIAIEGQFTRLAGGIDAAGAAMARLEAASAGGIDGTTLQQWTTTVLTAGGSVEQLAQMLDLAAKAAQATGRSQKELSGEFVKGYIEMSDGVFKALGLQVDFGQIVAKNATAMGVSADAIDLNTRRQWLLQAALAQGTAAFNGVPLEATTQQFNKLDAEIANVTDTMERRLLTVVTESAKAFGVLEGRSELGRAMQHAREVDVLAGSLEGLATATGARWLKDTIVGKSFSDEMAGVAAKIRHEVGLMEDAVRSGAISQSQLADSTSRATEAMKQQSAVSQAQARQRQLWRDTVAELARAQKAQYEQALGLARTAAAMGEATLAQQKYNDALGLAERVGVSFLDLEKRKREAIIATNKQLIETLKVQAEVALGAAQGLPTQAERDAAFREANELLDRYNNLRLGFDERTTASVPQPTGAKGASGRSDDPAQYALDQNRAGMAALRELLREQAAARRELDEAAAATAIAEAEAFFMDQDRWDGPVTAALERQAEAAHTLAEAFAAVSGPADALVQSLRTLGQVSFADGLAEAMPHLAAFAGAIQAAGLTQGKTAKQIAEGNAAIATSTSNLVASFISDLGVKYGVLGAGEIAASLASYPDPVGMFVHDAAAVAYFAAAGIAGAANVGGARAAGGGARSVPAPAVTPPPSMAERLNASPITINLAGATILGARAAEAARDLVDLIEREQGRRSRAPAMGGMR